MNGDLFLQHHETLRAFARRLTGNEADADDLVSATFEALPRALQRYEGRAPERSYLLGICANLWRRMTRSAAREERLYAAIDAAEPRAASDDPERAAALRQLTDRISRALAALPEAQRVAFILLNLEDRSAAHVARLCGVPEATVRTRAFHARRKLQAALRSELSGWSRRSASTLGLLLALILSFVVGTTSLGAPLRHWAHQVWQAAPWKHILPHRHAHPVVTAPITSRAAAGTQSITTSPAELAAALSAATVKGIDAATPSRDINAAPTPSTGNDAAQHMRAPIRSADARAPVPSKPTPLAPESAKPARADSEEERGRDSVKRGDTDGSPPQPPQAAPLELYQHAHRLYFVQHRYLEALAGWDNYLTLYPSTPLAVDARYYRALTLVRLQRLAEARLELEALLQDPEAAFRRDDLRLLLKTLNRR